MKTLSSSYENILKTGVVDFICICKITGTHKTTYVDKNFYISNRSIEIDDDTGAVSASDIPTQPILINSPNIIEQINVKEQTSSIGGFSIKIHNDGTFEDYNLYNRDIEIYFGDMSMDKLDDYDDSYYGVMGDITYSDTVITIQVTNSTKKVQKELPNTKIGQVYTYTPEETIGLPNPIVYGDRPFYYGYDGQTTTFNMVANQASSMVKCIDEGGNTWRICDHELNETESQYYRVWTKDPTTGRMLKLGDSDYSIETDSGGSYVELNSSFDFYDYWYPKSVSVATDTGVNWSNPENAIDDDYDTFSQSDLADTVVNGQIQRIVIDFPIYQPTQDATITEVKEMLVYLFDADTSYFQLTTEDEDTIIPTPMPLKSTKEVTIIDRLSPSKDRIGGEYTIKHECIQDAVAGKTSTAKVYMIFKQIKLAPERVDNLYIACKGKEASSTLAGKFSGLSTGDLLENPAHIIADVIVDELGITDIGTDFQASASVLTSWKYAPYINEFINSRELLDNLAGDCKSVVRWDYENNPSMSTFKDSYITDMVINGDDCSLPVCSKTKLDDIINKLELKYKKGEAYQTSIEREDDRTNTGSQDVYNFVSNTTKETDFIVDPTTVGYLADFYCKDDADSFWSVAHNIVEVELPLVGNHNYYGGNFIPYNRLELGDVVEFTNMPIKCNDEEFTGKQFLIISVTKGTRMKIKGYEV